MKTIIFSTILFWWPQYDPFWTVNRLHLWFEEVFAPWFARVVALCKYWFG